MAELLSVEIGEVIELVIARHLRGAQIGVPARWRVEEASIEGYLAAQAEESRRMALWRQSQEASFPEIWGASTAYRR